MTVKPHIRTCIACGRKAHKHELVRIVRLTDGGIKLDVSSKENGRGAYVCKDQACFTRACEKNMFGRRLKTKIHVEDMQKLANDFSALLNV